MARSASAAGKPTAKAPAAPSTARGIPDRARTTPIADHFFSHVLPQLASGPTVKVALHILWQAYRQAATGRPAQRVADLPADAALMSGILALGVARAEVRPAVERAVDELVDLGLLIEVGIDGPRGAERWILVNDSAGRQAHERLAKGGLLLPQKGPAAPAPGDARPTIYRLYEDNIGLITPMLAEELKDAEATYPPDWIDAAFEAAVEQNVRRWAYVRAILERWAREGHRDETNRRQSGRDRERDSEGPYAAFVER